MGVPGAGRASIAACLARGTRPAPARSVAPHSPAAGPGGPSAAIGPGGDGLVQASLPCRCDGLKLGPQSLRPHRPPHETAGCGGLATDLGEAQAVTGRRCTLPPPNSRPGGQAPTRRQAGVARDAPRGLCTISPVCTKRLAAAQKFARGALPQKVLTGCRGQPAS